MSGDNWETTQEKNNINPKFGREKILKYGEKNKYKNPMGKILYFESRKIRHLDRMIDLLHSLFDQR